MSQKLSISEEHGLEALPASAEKIYSIGVSTAGSAEIRMAAGNPKRRITATTIDANGLQHTAELLADSPFKEQITLKLEDTTKPLPYSDDTFDYVYARLVLHYLTKQQLTRALKEIARILKPHGQLFVVVRSDTCPDATRETSTYDPQTGMTTFISKPNKAAPAKIRSRFFHSEQSISEFVQQAGLATKHVSSYDEILFDDFNRSVPVDYADNVVELLAVK